MIQIRNLKLWQKIALVLSCFTIPLFATGRAMLEVIDSQIDAAKFEILGTDILSPLFKLDEIRNSDNRTSSSITTIVAQAENALSELIAEGERNGYGNKDPHFGSNLKDSVPALIKRRASTDIVDSSKASSNFYPEDREVVSDIADVSQLSLDPALDSYYLMLAVTRYGPTLLSTLGTGLNSPELFLAGPEGMQQRARFAKSLEELAQRDLPEAISKAIEADSKFYEVNHDLEERAQTALSKLDIELTNLNKTLMTGSDALDQVNLRKQLRACARETAVLMQTLVADLVVLINHRISFHRALAKETWALVAVGLALLPAIAWLVIRSITIPVGDLISTSLLAAESGDLTRKVSVQSTDEIGTLGNAFNQMIGNLRTMIEQVKKSGQIVKGTSTSISATAKQQQATASEIAATTLQIEATSKEISVTSAQLATTMKEVAAVAEGTTALASTGREGIVRMEETMLRISDACAAISDHLTVLSQKAGKIGTVVTTINKVADQTNLLSLNAAIEAEKAGDVGRGFAVVATEIRRLADQTAISTGDIELMIQEIQSAVSAGVMGIEKFADEVRKGVTEVKSVGGQLGQIINQVQTLPSHIDAVRDGMQSQSLGAQQITDGLGQLSQAAQQTADSLRSSNECIDQLTEASAMLEAGIKKFIIDGAA